MKSADEIKKGLECHTELDPDECSGVCPYSDNMFGCIPRLCDHALAYIQQLEKRVIHLEALNQSNLTTITMQERTRARLQEQISQLEAERDAAVKDMTKIVQKYGESYCEYCHNWRGNTCPPYCRTHSEGFKWRGVQEEE